MDFKKIEKKWQKKWEKSKIFQVKEASKKKFFTLEMFPYPSGSGLHMGHAFNYIVGDIYARFMRMNKLNVLYPMGYDSFGLPAENAALKEKIHPKKFTEDAIKNFILQQKSLGLSYDWSRMIKTSSPDYYKWNQYFFLKFFENGLVYRKKSNVNWCAKCNTVLANEQVHGGRCWRHPEQEVEIRRLEQWFIKTTKYADELLEGIEKLEWPERIKLMQENWIGRSEGTEILFEIPYEKETNFVLLHGYTGSPERNFFPWLKKELELKGHMVLAPYLPNTKSPNIKEQVEYVLKNCRFDENTVLLGHSLGSAVALKIIERLNVKIKKLVLAAGFCEPKSLDRQQPFEKTFDWKFDFQTIKRNVDEIIILRAKNDSAVPKDRADSLKKKIGGEIIDFVAEDDHICGKEEPFVLNACLRRWPIFTTRADTLFGVTFMVISAQHPGLMSIVTEKQKKDIEKFLQNIMSTKQEDLDKLEKEGVFTGSYALHPLTNEKIPIWVGNFVLADYGSGMVMAVPAHDQRDFEFAKKYDLPIKVVIRSDEKNFDKAYEGRGDLINSDGFNDITSEEAKEKITKELESKKLGKKTVQYKLRDWLISRQRYWGTPIPIIYCENCGIVPVPEKDLPVLLPEKIMFGKGNPLETNKNFVNVRCPKCKSKARRETDTMDTFFDSSWYFLRYIDNKNKKKPFEKKKIDYWMPVDQYIGGAEHAVMHLIYARFFVKALRDLGFVDIDEPFLRLFNQGMLHGADGFVMSKSRGNVVLPEKISDKYGIDTARLFLVSIASPDKDLLWSDEGIEGSFRFLNKIANLVYKIKIGKTSERFAHKLNKTIKELTEDIENFRYNLGVIKLRSLFDSLENEISKKDLGGLIKLLAPFCPHLAEEFWEKIGNKPFVSMAEWPKADVDKVNEVFDKVDEVVDKTLLDINNILRIIKEKQKKDIEKIYLYVLPKEKEFYSEEELAKRTGEQVKVYAVNEKDKYDPEGKAAKAKPGKPAIYVE
ncbi:MAG: leucine--tRNA ligase [Nanoarchaeota archaeon]